jgi:hypothetical protein
MTWRAWSTRASGALVMLAATVTRATPVRAQLPTPSTHPEARLDVVAGHQPAVQAGVGLQIPMGYYVRVGFDVAAGVATYSLPPSVSRVDARADLLVRFLLDPFRQSAYGLSLGGGVSARAEADDHVRPRLLVAVDLEGRRSAHGLVPALQLGLGGGLRVGVILRRGDRLAR